MLTVLTVATALHAQRHKRSAQLHWEFSVVSQSLNYLLIILLSRQLSLYRLCFMSFLDRVSVEGVELLLIGECITGSAHTFASSSTIQAHNGKFSKDIRR